jgi:hypothetical protein
LDHAKKAVADAKSRMENLRKRRQDLGKHADEEVANSDKATENVMELEDKAGTIGEKAEEEANKISVVKEAVVKEMKSVPELLTSAAAEEDEAAQLKRRAHEKLYDSRRKTDEADRLDRVAAEKEREAHMIRSRLVAILEEKTRLLDSKVRARPSLDSPHSAPLEGTRSPDTKAVAQVAVPLGRRYGTHSAKMCFPKKALQKLPRRRKSLRRGQPREPSWRRRLNRLLSRTWLQSDGRRRWYSLRVWRLSTAL